MSLLSQASLVVVPSGYKEDVVYSVKPTDGSGDLTFTRASDGTRVNSQGLVENVPWNLVAQSESIGTSPWLTNGATLTSGQTDPNGGTTAIKVELASGGNNYVYQGIPLTNPVNIVSAYLRADSATTIGFSMGGSTPNAVNLTTSWQLFTFSSTDTSGGIIFDNYFGPSPTQQAKTFYIWHPQLNQGTTAKPYFPTTDRQNVPRLDYSGGCPSLLLEPQRTNSLTYSEDFSNAAWTKNAGTITANNTTSPDGTQNADLFTADGTSTQHYVLQTQSQSAKTISMFVKMGTQRYVQILTSGTANALANYDLQTGSVGGLGSASTASMVDYGNGWWRIVLTSTDALTGNIYLCCADSLTDGRFPSTTSTGTIWVWGAMAENSASYPTSYIPTTSAAVTRVADVAYKTGISSLIGQTEGTLFWDGVATQGNYNQLMFIKDSSANQFIGLTVASGVIYGEIYNSGYVHLFSLAIASNATRFKLALAYKTNDFAFYVNGTQVSTASTGTTPTSFDDFYLGGTNNLRDWNCEVKQAILFSTRLTNTELAALTTL